VGVGVGGSKRRGGRVVGRSPSCSRGRGKKIKKFLTQDSDSKKKKKSLVATKTVGTLACLSRGHGMDTPNKKGRGKGGYPEVFSRGGELEATQEGRSKV